METRKPDADYVLFYVKVRSFLEDGCCTLKHTCRRIFEQLATDRGLAIDKYSMDLSEGAEGEAVRTDSTSRRRRGASKAAYRTFYWAFTASDEALLSEAEFVKLRLPLKDRAGNPLALRDKHPGCDDCTCSVACGRSEALEDEFYKENPLSDKRLDFITAPFMRSKHHLFFGGPTSPFSEEKSKGPDTSGFMDGSEAKKAEATSDGGGHSLFLTNAQRIYLTHSLLHRLDLSKELRRVLGPHMGTELCSVDCIYCRRLRHRVINNRPIVLEHLLDAKIFADEFAMHDESEPSWLRAAKSKSCASACCLCSCCGRQDEASVTPVDPSGSQEIPELTRAGRQLARTSDLRHRLYKTWSCCCSFQPLRHIRQYFGERLGFYYAWLGYVMCNLLVLSIVGLAFLVYGLVNASLNYKEASSKLIAQLNNSSSASTAGNAFSIHLIQLMQFIRLMFENHLTIAFTCALGCNSLASIIFWRKWEADLCHRWGVNETHLAEKRRPGFAPRRKLFSLVCGQHRKECRRFFGVLTFFLLFVVIAVAIAVAFHVSKLVASKRHCGGMSSHAECIFLSVILPITAHLWLMGLLDWVYSRLAKRLTDWENHEFRSDHDASYAMKAFAFRCANNYASLFYVAFVRQEHAMFGEFTDRCKMDTVDVDCYSLLNVYTAGYVIGKSLIKIVTDLLKPYLSSRSLMRCLTAPARRCLCTLCSGFKRAAYAAELRTVAALERQLVLHGETAELADPGNGGTDGKAPALRLAQERNLVKAKSRNQLLDEYLEKITLHGYLLLFGSACYVTPLAVLIALLIDLRLDSKRLLMSQRRPVPEPARGIEVWNRIHSLLSHAGIFSNGAILAFTSNILKVLGAEASLTNRLILFIAFCGFMFLFKHLMLACSKAQSNTRKMRRKWEYFHVPRILDTETVAEDAEKALHELRFGGRWYHVLLPCFAERSKPQAEAGLHQA